MRAGKHVLAWKTKDKEVRIRSLRKLLDILIDIRQDEIDDIISANINKKESKLVDWLEENYPKQLNLMAILKNGLREFSPQQIRESLIRELRNIT